MAARCLKSAACRGVGVAAGVGGVMAGEQGSEAPWDDAACHAARQGAGRILPPPPTPTPTHTPPSPIPHPQPTSLPAVLAPPPGDSAGGSPSSPDPDARSAGAPVTPNHLFIIVIAVILLLMIFGAVAQCIARRQGERFLDLLQRWRLGGGVPRGWSSCDLCCTGCPPSAGHEPGPASVMDEAEELLGGWHAGPGRSCVSKAGCQSEPKPDAKSGMHPTALKASMPPCLFASSLSRELVR